MKNPSVPITSAPGRNSAKFVKHVKMGLLIANSSGAVVFHTAF